MRRKQSMGEYLSSLASKCDVCSGDLLQAIFEARDNGKSKCGSLSIQCRSKSETKNTFLIMNGSEVVAQFPVSNDFLLNVGDSLMDFGNQPMKVSKPAITKEVATTQSCCIRDLRVGMNHVNLQAKIVEVTAPKRVNTRFGTIAILTKVLIEDETGQISLCLWNEQAENVAVGETIVIENAKVSKFGGKTQLSLGTRGKLCKESLLPVASLSVSELAAE